MNVAPGMPVFRVINFTKVKAVAEVAESYGLKIKTGDSVMIHLPDINKDIPAQLNFASRFINPINRTFMIEVRLDGKEPGLRANMVVVLKINDYKNHTALVVPVNVIQNSSNEKFVLIVSDEKGKKVVRKKNVITGYTYNGLTEVKEGLLEGDLVITQGYQDLKEGDFVIF
jgi:membrane fusion protein, multidrug efflux system